MRISDWSSDVCSSDLLIRVQRKYDPRGDRIFPYNPRSVGTAFRRACRALKIENLHFHDLRHEATSRLFEAGLRIEQVALVTGHRDWKMLKRYTHLRPEHRSEEHTSELQSLMRTPYAVFCLKKKKKHQLQHLTISHTTI